MMATPPNMAPYRLSPFFKSNVNNNRVINWTTAPEVKATITERKIPEMIFKAVEKLINFQIPLPTLVGSCRVDL